MLQGKKILIFIVQGTENIDFGAPGKKTLLFGAPGTENIDFRCSGKGKNIAFW